MHLFGRISHALAKRPVQKNHENQRFFNDFENALFVFISLFFILDGPKGPFETPSGERSGDFGVPRAPSEIGERPPWAPWASPRAPSRLPLSGPGRKQMGPSQHRKSQFPPAKTILSAMPSFDNPPFNWSHNFLTVFLVFSSASLPFFLFFDELSFSYFDFIVGVCS